MSFVHFFCLIKRNEPKKNQVRLKASTCGRRSQKQPLAQSPNASLFVRYAAKRTVESSSPIFDLFFQLVIVVISTMLWFEPGSNQCGVKYTNNMMR